ncbi:UDP-glycosyltransferase 90A1-like [Solanum dulcamara]|uniref:UDP-glycosyltransferase 90A1-like n=1 Tax=Solanum dulcamara TaxID=45834 RepID=UPI0024864CBB|nr:UDP-glycosyltransferase 90A1-like [Solanum dulcamara]
MGLNFVRQGSSVREEPVVILDRDVRKLRTKEIKSVKIQWKHSAVEESTWETEKEMQDNYPQLRYQSLNLASPPTVHVVLFPFMSKGHTIPMFDLARLLLTRNISITIFTTPANRPFFSDSLPNTNINIIEIPFPQNIQGVPPDVESTDKLISMSLLYIFANATKLMKPHFEKALESLPPVTFMITDGFLSWTLDSANKTGIPRLVYYGISAFSWALSISALSVLRKEVSDDESYQVPDFPWIKLTRNDFDLSLTQRPPF